MGILQHTDTRVMQGESGVASFYQRNSFLNYDEYNCTFQETQQIMTGFVYKQMHVTAWVKVYGFRVECEGCVSKA